MNNKYLKKELQIKYNSIIQPQIKIKIMRMKITILFAILFIKIK